MNKHSMIFIILDTHKEFYGIAYCEERRGASAVHYGCKQHEAVFNKLRAAVYSIEWCITDLNSLQTKKLIYIFIELSLLLPLLVNSKLR
ncbi:hypothetical protein [Alteromonas genovensis]|uniref:hypothetical protein n=1 Tax=Alteromonas genovensis TaxID=471225 RepID=UPI003A5C146C